MFTFRNVYIALMLVAGVALGFLVRAKPAIAEGAIPPLLWLLLVSLIIDVAAMAIAASKGDMPIPMNARVAGFIGAALLYTGVTMLGAAA